MLRKRRSRNEWNNTVALEMTNFFSLLPLQKKKEKKRKRVNVKMRMGKINNKNKKKEQKQKQNGKSNRTKCTNNIQWIIILFSSLKHNETIIY